MDIKDFDTRDRAAEGIEWTLKDPNGIDLIGSDGEPVKFTTRGVDSAKERGRIAKAKPVHERSDAEAYGNALMESDAKYLADFLVGWTENFTYGGEPFPFNKANAVKAMSIPFIAAQQNGVLLERSNFMKRATD